MLEEGGDGVWVGVNKGGVGSGLVFRGREDVPRQMINLSLGATGSVPPIPGLSALMIRILFLMARASLVAITRRDPIRGPEKSMMRSCSGWASLR